MSLPDDVRALLHQQSGVIARRQALASGLQPHDVRRLLRRREWAVAFPGVCVAHTGELSWQQRAWVAVLTCWPAALAGASAVRAAAGPALRGHDDTGPLHLVVDRSRRSLVAPPGVVVHHRSGFADRVLWTGSPPRLRLEDAVIDVAAAARSEMRAIAVLSDAVQARLTTAERLRSALESRGRTPRRLLLSSVLDDLATGVCSALEHGYLVRVERAHGLPRGERQVRDTAPGSLYRDVEYAELGLVVELDGRLFHDSATARDLDLERDLAAALTQRLTVRVGWGQVYDRPCATAASLGALASGRGWRGRLRACPRCPGGVLPTFGATA